MQYSCDSLLLQTCANVEKPFCGCRATGAACSKALSPYNINAVNNLQESESRKSLSFGKRNGHAIFPTFQFPQGFHSELASAKLHKPFRNDLFSRQNGENFSPRTGVTLAQTHAGASNRARPSQNPGREKKDGLQERQNALHGDAHDAKRQQNQPDERIKNQGKQRKRPTEAQQDAPE